MLFRPTTRICHAYANIQAPADITAHEFEGFVKDSKKWVIFPRLSFMNHAMIEKRIVEIGDDFSASGFNEVSGAADSKKVVFTGGVSYAYVKEALADLKEKKAQSDYKELLNYMTENEISAEQVLDTLKK